MYNKNIRSFISDRFPDFVSSEHPNFVAFIEAYYEWLEQQNTGTSTSVLDLFKEMPNPGALVSQAASYRDVDTSIDAYLNFFKSEIMPIGSEFQSVDDPFMIKKIRDVYLSKGTPKSYKLLFRLLYNQEIDFFVAKENIIGTSSGKWLSYPFGFMKVVEFSDQIKKMDFQLASIEDSEKTFIGSVVSIENIGTTPDGFELLKVKFGDQYSIPFGRTYVIRGAGDTSEKIIKFEMLPTISDVLIKKDGYLYSEYDNVRFSSKYFDKKYTGQPTVTQSGPITKLIVADRGSFYTVGDTFSFYSKNITDGSGGGFIVSGVDSQGRITQIDGIEVRSGELNNGFPSGTLNRVEIPISSGGIWRTIPDIKYNSKGNFEGAGPYHNGVLSGSGLVAIAIPESTGRLESLVFNESPYFLNDSDVNIVIPMNVVLDNPDTATLNVGQNVSFQTFVDSDTGAFMDDSEELVFSLRFKRSVETGAHNYYAANTISLPNNFDSDLFQWVFGEYVLDSELGFQHHLAAWEASTTLNHSTTFVVDEVADGGSYSAIGTSDSEGGFMTLAVIDAAPGQTSGSFIAYDSDTFSGTLIEGGHGFDEVCSQYLDVRFHSNDYLDKLDSFHYDRLNAFEKNNSDLVFQVKRVQFDPSNYYSEYAGRNKDIGQWFPTGFYGQIDSIDGNIYKVIPTTNQLTGADLPFPSDSEIDSLSYERYKFLRVEPVDQNLNELNEHGLPLDNIVSYHSTAKVSWTLGGVSISANKFQNEDGFLSSPSGGVLQDGYFFSQHTYIVQSALTVDIWREKIKTMLHPAGMIMFGETNFDQISTRVSSPLSATTFNTGINNMTFDSMLENYESTTNFYAVGADNVNYKTNAFEVTGVVNSNGMALSTDSWGELRKIETSSQNGNGYWDHEPIGFVHIDPLYGNETTQDSDGFGYLKNERRYFEADNGTVQDFYKGESGRKRFDEPKVMTLATIFFDTVNERYDVWDSDLTTKPTFFSRFSDSDNSFHSINYSQIRSDVEIRNISSQSPDRTAELTVKKEKDFQKAMKEDGTYSFVSDAITYTGFDAFEKKWHAINDQRTINTQGWMINGFTSVFQNASYVNGRYLGSVMDQFNGIKPTYTLQISPLSPEIWDDGALDSDYWSWGNSYAPEINNGDNLLTFREAFSDSSETPVTPSDLDPQKLMNKRRE